MSRHDPSSVDGFPDLVNGSVFFSRQPVASTSQQTLDLAHDEGDMIIEEEEDNEEGHEDEFVVEEDEDEPPSAAATAATAPPRKRQRIARKVGNERARATSAAPASRFTSTKDRAFPCARCSQAYTRFEHLARHLVRLHLEPHEQAEYAEKMICLECSTSFSRPELLQQHYKSRHASSVTPDWRALREVYDEYIEVATRRNKRELAAAQGIHTNGDDETWAPIGCLPAAPKKTRWTTHWRRVEAASEDLIDEQLSDREWEEDEGFDSIQRRTYTESSVYQPAGVDFLPPPPAEDSDDEFVFEEDETETANAHAYHRPRDGVSQRPPPPVALLSELQPLQPVPRIMAKPPTRRTDSTGSARMNGASRKKPPAPVATDSSQEIVLTIVDSRTKRGMRFKTGARVKLDSILGIFRQQSNLTGVRLLFFHRGRAVDTKLTPEEAGMSDKDMIWFDIDDRPDLAPNGDVAVPQRQA